METKTENFDLRSALAVLPYPIRKMCKRNILEAKLCSKGTYNNWLSGGIPVGSTSLHTVKRYIQKYEALLHADPIEILLSKKDV